MRIADRARDDPAAPGERRRQQELEPARRLIGGPARRRASPRRGRRGSGRTPRTGAAGTRRRTRCSCSGKTVARSCRKSGDLLSCSMNELARAGDRAARRCRCRCPTRAPWAGLAGRPAGRPAQAEEGPRQAGRRDSARRRPEVAPDERLDADREQDDRQRRRRDERQPVELAGEREVVRRPAEPGQVRERRDGGDGGLVAVEDEAAEHDRAGDADRRATAQERGDGERERRPRRARAAPARSRSRRPPSTEISSPGRPLNGAAGDDEGRGTRGPIAKVSAARWPNSFSSAIRRRRDRRRRDELQAAAARLRGERAGQREDRPQAGDDREERAVLVLRGSRPASRR